MKCTNDRTVILPELMTSWRFTQRAGQLIPSLLLQNKSPNQPQFQTPVRNVSIVIQENFKAYKKAKCCYLWLFSP